MIRRLRKIEEGLAKVERFLLCGVLSLVLLIAFLQVILRKFSFGFIWADVLLRHLVLWAGFLGAVLAAREEKHFAVDALARLLPKRGQLAFLMIGRLLGATASFVLAWASWIFVRDEWAAESVLFTLGRTDIYAAWFQGILPVAFLLMGLHFLMRLTDPPRVEEPA